MNKKVLGIVLTLSLAFIVLATGSVPAFASPTTYINHFNAAVWSSVIEVPGQPKIGLVCFHFDKGYVGRGDAIVINFWVGPPYFWMTVAGYSDSPSDVALEKMVSPSGAAIYLVKPWQIQVCRLGKIVMAYWTVPLVAPATALTPAVTIPPGSLVLKGYGDVFHMTLGPLPTGVPGWSVTYEGQNYAAHETLFCPGWHYFGPVATEPPLGAGTPSISVEGTQTFSHP
jgi:hypothetical protein